MRAAWIVFSSVCWLVSCDRPREIHFTQVPDAGPGGSERTETIAGRVTGARSGERIVLFAHSGTWWVQPASSRPFTAVGKDATWSTATHLGTEYAALLVSPDYMPPRTTDALPAQGGGVLAVASIEGKPSAALSQTPPKIVRFSGYEWEVMQSPSDSGGVMHENRAGNAWTDAAGRLHLRIAREGKEWTCAEVLLTRSLGYGTYSFAVNATPAMEPGAVLGMFTWDPLESGQNNREIDVELSQWGDPDARNAQYVVQPYYVPANAFRFNSPASPVTHTFRWEPGKVSFQSTSAGGRTVAEHVFTSGVPTPGGERVHLNLYIYGKSRTPQQRGVEVVIEKFAYLP